MLTALFMSWAALFGGQLSPAPVTAQIPKPGALYGTVVIPRIQERVPVRQGVDHDSVLSRGVGHSVASYGPGMGGTILFFGHRVTPVLGESHGPFRYIDRLMKGDRITVRMPYGRYTYRVRQHLVLTPAAVKARFRPSLKRETLVLTACHPPGSRLLRYVVVA